MGVVLFHRTFRAVCWVTSYMTKQEQTEWYSGSRDTKVVVVVWWEVVSTWTLSVSWRWRQCSAIVLLCSQCLWNWFWLLLPEGWHLLWERHGLLHDVLHLLSFTASKKQMGVNSQQQRQILLWSPTIILVGVEVLWALSDDNYTCAAGWPLCRWCCSELSKSCPQSTGEVVASSSSAFLPLHPWWVLFLFNVRNVDTVSG